MTYVSLIIYAAFSFGAGVASVWLPETKGQPIPETLEEAENFPNKIRKVVDDKEETNSRTGRVINDKEETNSRTSIENGNVIEKF